MITTKFKEIRLFYNICYGKIKYCIIQFFILQLHLQIKLDILIKKNPHITVKNKQTKTRVESIRKELGTVSILKKFIGNSNVTFNCTKILIN